MKQKFHGLLPVLMAAAGLLGLGGVLANEIANVRRGARATAEHDLASRAALVRDSLARPLERSDFAAVYAIAEACENDGLRLSIFGREGRGRVFDSRLGCVENGFLFASEQTGEFTIRLGIPKASVYAAAERGRLGLILAGFTGAAGLMLVFLSMRRVRARLRELEAIQRAESFRKTFIADVSHEIKTPLTGILGTVELLEKEEHLGKEERARLLEMLKTEANALNSLAQGILNLAKLEHSREKHLTMESVDLGQTAQSAVERMSTRARAAGVDLSLAPDTRPAIVSANAAQIEEALVNLIDNAIRHSRSPKVELAVHGKSVSVEDWGVGLSADDQSHVFERFWRADPARAADTGGSGLGLAIVKEIVRINGASIALDSTPGKGCRFTIRFR